MKFSKVGNAHQIPSLFSGKDEHRELERWRFFLYLLSCLPLFYLAWVNRNYQLDDALIYLRYIRNFLNGEGLVYNLGAYFNGLTSPLYSYLIILAGVLVNNLQTANILSAAIFHASALIIFTEVFFIQQSLTIRCLFIFLAGTFPYFFLVYGMETPLFMLMIGLCVYCYRKEQYFWLGVFSGFLILTRVEGVFLVVVLLVGYLLRHRRLPTYKYFIVPLCLVSANLIFNRLYYGAYLPATGSAKIWQGQSGLWGEGWLFLQVGYLFGWVFSSSYLYLFTVTILSLLGFINSIWIPGNREIHCIAAAFLVGYSCFFIFLNIPNYHWYYAPYFMFALVYCTEGILFLANRLSRILRDRWLWAARSSIVLLVATLIYWGSSVAGINRSSFTPYKNIGIWLSQNTEKDAKVALVEIGTIGWYSHRYIVDILGLVNPLNARFIGEKKFEEWLNHYSPDYILIHDPPWPHEVGAGKARGAGRFERDLRFNFAGYELLKRVPQPALIP